ncbi:MAG: transposase zinc-binding domain-containing protein [Clostridium sp.]
MGYVGIIRVISRINNKITVKEILVDKYEEFKEKNWYRIPEVLKEQIDNLVNKSLSCGNIENGFAEYICQDCGDITKVPFTCKSKSGNSCGRLYTLKWAEKQQKNMLIETVVEKNIYRERIQISLFNL